MTTPDDLSGKLEALVAPMEAHEKRMEFLFDQIVGLRDKQTDPELHESLNSMKYVLSGRPACVHESIPLLRAAAQALREQGERVKVLEEALGAIANVTERPSDHIIPSDWQEQIRACPECQRYSGHPIQQGICNSHRKPLYAREAYEKNETRMLGYRAKEIARAALTKERGT